MKRYALYHLEEELFLIDNDESGYDLDSDLQLYTKGELEFIFFQHKNTDNDVLTVETSDGSLYYKSDFDIIEFTLKEKERYNFNDFLFD